MGGGGGAVNVTDVSSLTGLTGSINNSGDGLVDGCGQELRRDRGPF